MGGGVVTAYRPVPALANDLQTPEELTRRIDMMFQDYIRGVALRLKAPAAVYA